MALLDDRDVIMDLRAWIVQPVAVFLTTAPRRDAASGVAIMPENKALWLNAKRAPFTVGPAPYTAPRADEIVVRARAVAVNPVDRLYQPLGDFITPWIAYPFVVGSDVAGEVVEVGDAVTRFSIGDRVVGLAAGSDKSRNRAAEGAFQDYVVLLAHMAAPIPDAMAFAKAAVLPLGLSTAACGLFQKDFLAMNAPSAAPKPAGKTLLVWGGSTSVGSNAIQLAVAAGYDVVTTASPRNFDYVKRLGAREAFDYRSRTVVSDIVSALRGREIAGALAIGAGSAAACVDIVAACQGAPLRGAGDAGRVLRQRARRTRSVAAAGARHRADARGQRQADAEGQAQGRENQVHLGQRADRQRGRADDLRGVPAGGAGARPVRRGAGPTVIGAGSGANPGGAGAPASGRFRRQARGDAVSAPVVRHLSSA